MTELPALPDRLSVDPQYPGFREDALYIAVGILILLNGEKQRFVVAYDVPGSSVTRFCVDTAGHFQMDGDELRLETVRGRVEVARQAS